MKPIAIQFYIDEPIILILPFIKFKKEVVMNLPTLNRKDLLYVIDHSG